jgi:DNA-binding NtrC family response regulator
MPAKTASSELFNRAMSDILRSRSGDSNSLVLLIKSDGKILDFLSIPDNRHTIIFQELLLKKDLNSFFDFSSVSGKAQESVLVQNKPFEWNFYDEFFTTLPLSKLFLRHVGKDQYIGHLTFYQYIPEFYGHNATILIFTHAHKDILLGYTPMALFQYFRPDYPSPTDLLGQPLNRILTPSPKEIQLNEAAGLGKNPFQDLKPRVQVDFSRPGDLEKIEFSHTDGFTWLSNQAAWENTSESIAFITLKTPVNSMQCDFALTVTLEGGDKNLPVITIGEQYFDENRLPDNHGYLAGPDYTKRQWALKRYGFMCTCTPMKAIDTGPHTLRLGKIGHTLVCTLDNVTVFTFFDNEYLHHEKTYLSLGLRNRCSTRLRGMQLEIRDHKSGQDRPDRSVVQIRTAPDRHYTLDRFYNFTLSQDRFHHVAGYFLSDISALQQKIQVLDTRVQHHARREKKLMAQLRREKLEDSLVGSSRTLAAIKQVAETVAPSSATVLIEGPTGAGKEVVARYIQAISPRKEKPFVKVDCATIPPNLIESHLFGHEKGAFTGAHERSIGMFEKAHTGTLFLDEVGNLTPEVQAKLLQFLNDFTVSRIGSSEPIKLDVRCIAASNIPLLEMVKSGRFREDLYYRINVIRIKVPSLRERKEDLTELCDHFIKQFNRENKKGIKGITPEALKIMESHTWPGNIRELRNAIHRAVLFSHGEFIEANAIHLQSGAAAPSPAPGRKPHSAFQMDLTDRDYVTSLLKEHAGRVNQVAAALGVSRMTLYRYLKKTGIDSKTFRRGFGQ